MDDFLKYCKSLDDKEVYAETVMLEKEDRFGIFQLLGCEMLTTIIKIDSTNEENPAVFVFTDLEVALKNFKFAISDCEKNGWTVVKRGKPQWTTTSSLT